MRFRRRYFGVSFAAAATIIVVAVPALADVCHPDARGTRTLLVRGSVIGYDVRGSEVRIAYRDPSGCTRVNVWHPLGALANGKDVARRSGCSHAVPAFGNTIDVPEHAASVLAASDGTRRVLLRGDTISLYNRGRFVRGIARRGSIPAVKIALNGDRILILGRAPAESDQPDRLEVYDVRAGRFLHDWPLIARPETLDVSERVAVFSAAGLYAVRLSDGRSTYLGPIQHADRPQISGVGVAFQSNLSERLNRQGKIAMKFIPETTLRTSFARTFAALDTRWPIASFSMDGPRVAALLDAPKSICDHVQFWNIPWHWVGRINMEHDLTCHRGMSIRSLSLGGIRAMWVATKGSVANVIVSDSKTCMEHVVATTTTASEVSLSGDGNLFGYAIGGNQQPGTIGLAVGVSLRRPLVVRNVASFTTGARAVSADGDRLAALGTDGRVVVLSASGDVVATFAPTAPRAIALRGQRLVALTESSALEVWNTATGAREHVWPVPKETTARVDLHFGIAVFTAGRRVYAMRIDDGRAAVLARPPRPARIEIDGSGVVYQYNVGHTGSLRFITLAEVERKLAD